MAIKRSEFLKGSLALSLVPGAGLLGCKSDEGKGQGGSGGGAGAGTGGSSGGGTGGGGPGGGSGSGGSPAAVDAGDGAAGSGGSGAGGIGGGSGGSGGTPSDGPPPDLAGDAAGTEVSGSCAQVTAKFDMHTHTLTVPPEHVRGGVKQVYTAGGNNHMHDVVVGPADFQGLAEGKTVKVLSSSFLGHAHIVTLMCA